MENRMKKKKNKSIFNKIDFNNAQNLLQWFKNSAKHNKGAPVWNN